MSLGLFGLLVVWLVDGNIKGKLLAFWNNKTALIISSIYLITVLGLIHTSNFEFALDDLRRKLPIFFIPFYVSGLSPITKKEFHFLLKVYLTGVIIATLWSLFVYLGGLNEEILDLRDLSRFNSHIRFGLEISLAAFIGVYFLYNSANFKEKAMWLLLVLWLIASFVIFSLFSGLIIFTASTVLLLISLSLQSKKGALKYASISLILLLAICSGYFLTTTVSEYNNCNLEKSLEALPLTAKSNKYRVDKKTRESNSRENGYLIERHVADKEFADAWNLRSTIDYKGLDLRGNQLYYTLRRFVSSKGLRKDQAAIDQLTTEEVEAIERGVPNYKYLEMGYFRTRIFKILWEYQSSKEGRSVNGHSVFMKLEYWKTAIQIIKKNLLFGVGTGDVQDSFDAEYVTSKSNLGEKYRLRTHNQFLAYGVSFGALGIVLFLIFLFYPLIKLEFYKNNIYFAFLSIVLLSMLTEDTLEVQAGINFFAFFNSLFLLKSKENQLHEI